MKLARKVIESSFPSQVEHSLDIDESAGWLVGEVLIAPISTNLSASGPSRSQYAAAIT